MNSEINESDSIFNAIKKYGKHLSVIKSKAARLDSDSFSFTPTDPESVLNLIVSLNHSKASPSDSIPPRIIKLNGDILASKFSDDINTSINSGKFPNNF